MPDPSHTLLAVVLLAAAYLLGSLPFGLYIAKVWKGIDVREHGSGNIGATNVYRVVGRPAGAVVFVLDVGKGFVPPFVAQNLGLNASWAVGAGLAAMLGHNFSPFLGFKGGKGVATSLGVLLGVAPKVGIAGFVIWTTLVVMTGYVSVASIAAAVSLTPLALYFYPGSQAILAFVIIAALVSIVKHRANIVRLLNGTESSFRRPPKDESDVDEPPSAQDTVGGVFTDSEDRE